MSKNDIHGNIHCDNKIIRTRLDGEGSICKNIMAMKLIENSFSTFKKILIHLNETCMPYYLCGGTGSLEVLCTLGMTKVHIGEPLLTCTECHRSFEPDDMHYLLTCEYCGSPCDYDGFPENSVYFWNPGNCGVHFEICVNEEAFDWICANIGCLSYPSPSSDERVIKETQAERVLVYRRITVRCDGTVPNRRYSVPQNIVSQRELMDFARADIFSGNSKLAPGCESLLDLSYIKAKALTSPIYVVNLFKGTYNQQKTEFTLHDFIDKHCNDTLSIELPVSPEELILELDTGGFSYSEAIRLTGEIMSRAPLADIDSVYALIGRSIIPGIPSLPRGTMKWLTIFSDMKSFYEALDFVAMHYLLSL